MSETSQIAGPDLQGAGIAENDLTDGRMLVGRVQDEKVLCCPNKDSGPLRR